MVFQKKKIEAWWVFPHFLRKLVKYDTTDDILVGLSWLGKIPFVRMRNDVEMAFQRVVAISTVVLEQLKNCTETISLTTGRGLSVFRVVGRSVSV